MQWKGISRKWEDKDSKFSASENSKKWLPNLPEYTEEDDDGSAKQVYILIDDIDEPHKSNFVSWAGSEVKQLTRTIEEDQGEVTTDVVVKCIKVRIWKRWVRKNL